MSDIIVDQTTRFAGSTSQVPNASAGLGENDFLKLLAIQLQYQDPLDPLENTEFIAQMAQFSSLEGITSMNTSIKGMSEQLLSMSNLSTTSLIGKQVKVFGNDFTLSEGKPSELQYLLKGGAANVKINITDSNGIQIRSIAVGSQPTGNSKIIWDGLDDAGVNARAGDYTFSVEATGNGGAEVESSTVRSDIVDGIVYENGVPFLMIDGSRVGMNEILEVWGS